MICYSQRSLKVMEKSGSHITYYILCPIHYVLFIVHTNNTYNNLKGSKFHVERDAGATTVKNGEVDSLLETVQRMYTVLSFRIQERKTIDFAIAIRHQFMNASV
uniref:Uncharacterized protein n=1 Tax=Glossina brevipalpis TaxID=37001 RepID=A0A1A9W038_9MUSC